MRTQPQSNMTEGFIWPRRGERTSLRLAVSGALAAMATISAVVAAPYVFLILDVVR